MEHKPFLETKVGQWIQNNAPGAVSLVENFVPQPVKGALDIVKKIVATKHPELGSEKFTELDRILAEVEVEMIRLYNEEMANARGREIDLAKITGKKDYLLWALSMAGILIPVLLLGYLIYTGKPVDPLVAGFVGVIVGSYMVVFNYHFGSSSGSARKQATIDTMMSSDGK